MQILILFPGKRYVNGRSIPCVNVTFLQAQAPTSSGGASAVTSDCSDDEGGKNRPYLSHRSLPTKTVLPVPRAITPPLSFQSHFKGRDIQCGSRPESPLSSALAKLNAAGAQLDDEHDDLLSTSSMSSVIAKLNAVGITLGEETELLSNGGSSSTTSTQVSSHKGIGSLEKGSRGVNHGQISQSPPDLPIKQHEFTNSRMVTDIM